MKMVVAAMQAAETIVRDTHVKGSFYLLGRRQTIYTDAFWVFRNEDLALREGAGGLQNAFDVAIVQTFRGETVHKNSVIIWMAHVCHSWA